MTPFLSGTSASSCICAHLCEIADFSKGGSSEVLVTLAGPKVTWQFFDADFTADTAYTVVFGFVLPEAMLVVIETASLCPSGRVRTATGARRMK